MKVHLVLVFLEIVFLSVFGIEDDKYRSEINDGKYYPDNEGQYIPDYSGRYYHDYSGNYKHDGTGIYNGDVKGRYAEKRSSNALPNFNTIPSESRQNKLVVIKKIKNPILISENKYKTVRQVDEDVNTNGYRWKYEENNRFSYDKDPGPDKRSDGKGIFRYSGPNNLVYSIVYTKDPNSSF